jgi:UPF0716 protein FxsA
MARLIIYPLILIPVIEITVFILLGDFFTFWQLIFITLATAIIGITIIKKRGLQTLYRAQDQLKTNILPIEEIYKGMFLVVSAAFLLTPGFITDLFGFLLFVPSIRNIFKAIVTKSLVANVNLDAYMKNNNSNSATAHYTTIDGEFEEVNAPNPHKTNKKLN